MHFSISVVTWRVKYLPAIWKTWVRSLGCKDPLEDGMATHSSILAWRIPKDKATWWGYGPWGRKESDMTGRLSKHTHSIFLDLLPRWWKQNLNTCDLIKLKTSSQQRKLNKQMNKKDKSQMGTNCLQMKWLTRGLKQANSLCSSMSEKIV